MPTWRTCSRASASTSGVASALSPASTSCPSGTAFPSTAANTRSSCLSADLSEGEKGPEGEEQVLAERIAPDVVPQPFNGSDMCKVGPEVGPVLVRARQPSNGHRARRLQRQDNEFTDPHPAEQRPQLPNVVGGGLLGPVRVCLGATVCQLFLRPNAVQGWKLLPSSADYPMLKQTLFALP
jgi:hypothetical protein